MLVVVEGGVCETTEELVDIGIEVSSAVVVGAVENDELRRLVLVALPTRLDHTELALASLSVDKDDRTLRTELVALKPVVIVGVVPARLIVRVVVRPSAPLSAVLAAVEILIAGVIEDRELVEVDIAPFAW